MKWIALAWGTLALAEWALRHALVDTGWGMTLLHAGADPAALAPGLALIALRLTVVSTAPLLAAALWLRLGGSPRPDSVRGNRRSRAGSALGSRPWRES